jgi:hypothetical protein
VKSDTVRLTYRGGVRGVSMLAQMLEEQGVSVRYTPPRETRDMTEAAAIVVVVLSATGNSHDIAAAVQMFRQKFGSHAQIEALPEPEQSVEERLAAVDRLLADGKITPEEHAQQRTPNPERALGERRVEDTPGRLHFRRSALLQPVRSRERLTLERTPRFSVEA